MKVKLLFSISSDSMFTWKQTDTANNVIYMNSDVEMVVI